MYNQLDYNFIHMTTNRDYGLMDVRCNNKCTERCTNILVVNCKLVQIKTMGKKVRQHQVYKGTKEHFWQIIYTI